jgi:hypothetical protein
MTPAQLIRLCEAIYGPERGDYWKTQLARDVGVLRRTVHRWLDGEREIPPGLKAELLQIQRLRAPMEKKRADLMKRRPVKTLAEGDR